MARAELTSEELVGACLARIAELEPQVQAWAFLDRERALAQAKAADEHAPGRQGRRPPARRSRRHQGHHRHGRHADRERLPVFKGRQPGEDAACVAALRRAGAVILGKTVTTELATLTPSRRATRVNLEHTPGGSSSGSAAAVAAGMVPLARRHADGRLRHPAGRLLRHLRFQAHLRRHPAHRRAHAVAVRSTPSACYGRSVEDLALTADALQGHDARDAASLSTSRPRLLATATEDWPLAPLFAFVKTHAWSRCRRGHARGFRRAGRGSSAARSPRSRSTARPSAASPPPACPERRDGRPLRPALDRAPELLSKAHGQPDRGRPPVRGVDYFTALNARERFYATRRGHPARLRHHPHARRARTRAQGPRHHRQSGFCGSWTYLRRAGGDAAAAGGRRHADGRAARRPRAATTAACCAPRAGSQCRRLNAGWNASLVWRRQPAKPLTAARVLRPPCGSAIGGGREVASREDQPHVRPIARPAEAHHRARDHRPQGPRADRLAHLLSRPHRRHRRPVRRFPAGGRQPRHGHARLRDRPCRCRWS